MTISSREKLAIAKQFYEILWGIPLKKSLKFTRKPGSKSMFFDADPHKIKEKSFFFSK
jgi:hypothetical protein